MLLFAMSLTLTSCFGGFQLTRNLYSLNEGISSEPIVQTLVFWGLNVIPVYPLAVTADFLIFNFIEFWSGTNPLAMNELDSEQQYVYYKGDIYLMKAEKNNFEIFKIEKNNQDLIISLSFNQEDNTIIANNLNNGIVVGNFK